MQNIDKLHNYVFKESNLRFPLIHSEASTLEQDEFYGYVDSRTDYNNMVEEIITTKTSASKLMNRYKFGSRAKLSKKVWGGDTDVIFKIFKKVFSNGAGFKKSSDEVVREIKEEVQEFQKIPDGDTGNAKRVPNVSDYEIRRLIVTEYAVARVINQLLEWKQMGFTHVRSKVRLTKNSGKKDKENNGKVFSIDYLLSRAGDGDRIPYHPHCRCIYLVVRNKKSEMWCPT